MQEQVAYARAAVAAGGGGGGTADEDDTAVELIRCDFLVVSGGTGAGAGDGRGDEPIGWLAGAGSAAPFGIFSGADGEDDVGAVEAARERIEEADEDDTAGGGGGFEDDDMSFGGSDFPTVYGRGTTPLTVCFGGIG